MPACCDGANEVIGDDQNAEVVRIRKTEVSCSLCEDYVKRNSSKPIAVVSCEGACLRGEISRQAANEVCRRLPDQTVRVCLGSAFTKDGGQRGLVRNAERALVLEGCAIDCASRMLEGVLPGCELEVVRTDALAHFDKRLFPVDALSAEEIARISTAVAKAVVERIAGGV